MNAFKWLTIGSIFAIAACGSDNGNENGNEASNPSYQQPATLTPNTIAVANLDNLGDVDNDVLHLRDDGQLEVALDSGDWRPLPVELEPTPLDETAATAAELAQADAQPEANETSATALAQVASGNLSGEDADDIVILTDDGRIYYSDDLQQWLQVPGILDQVALCDLDGDGWEDLLGILDGGIRYTLDLENWELLAGDLVQLICGDLDGDGANDIGGITPLGVIGYTLDLENWNYLRGPAAQIAAGDIDGDGDADLVGVSTLGTMYYTLNLKDYRKIPGQMQQVAVGDFDSDLDGDLVGISADGEVYFSQDLATWQRKVAAPEPPASYDFSDDSVLRQWEAYVTTEYGFTKQEATQFVDVLALLDNPNLFPDAFDTTEFQEWIHSPEWETRFRPAVRDAAGGALAQQGVLTQSTFDSLLDLLPEMGNEIDPNYWRDLKEWDYESKTRLDNPAGLAKSQKVFAELNEQINISRDDSNDAFINGHQDAIASVQHKEEAYADHSRDRKEIDASVKAEQEKIAKEAQQQHAEDEKTIEENGIDEFMRNQAIASSLSGLVNSVFGVIPGADDPDSQVLENLVNSLITGALVDPVAGGAQAILGSLSVLISSLSSSTPTATQIIMDQLNEINQKLDTIYKGLVAVEITSSDIDQKVTALAVKEAIKDNFRNLQEAAGKIDTIASDYGLAGTWDSKESKPGLPGRYDRFEYLLQTDDPAFAYSKKVQGAWLRDQVFDNLGNPNPPAGYDDDKAYTDLVASFHEAALDIHDALVTSAGDELQPDFHKYFVEALVNQNLASFHNADDLYRTQLTLYYDYLEAIYRKYTKEFLTAYQDAVFVRYAQTYREHFYSFDKNAGGRYPWADVTDKAALKAYLSDLEHAKAGATEAMHGQLAEILASFKGAVGTLLRLNPQSYYFPKDAANDLINQRANDFILDALGIERGIAIDILMPFGSNPSRSDKALTGYLTCANSDLSVNWFVAANMQPLHNYQLPDTKGKQIMRIVPNADYDFQAVIQAGNKSIFDGVAGTWAFSTDVDAGSVVTSNSIARTVNGAAKGSPLPQIVDAAPYWTYVLDLDNHRETIEKCKAEAGKGAQLYFKVTFGMKEFGAVLPVDKIDAKHAITVFSDVIGIYDRNQTHTLVMNDQSGKGLFGQLCVTDFNANATTTKIEWQVCGTGSCSTKSDYGRIHHARGTMGIDINAKPLNWLNYNGALNNESPFTIVQWNNEHSRQISGADAQMIWGSVKGFLGDFNDDDLDYLCRTFRFTSDSPVQDEVAYHSSYEIETWGGDPNSHHGGASGNGVVASLDFMVGGGTPVSYTDRVEASGFDDNALMSVQILTSLANRAVDADGKPTVVKQGIATLDTAINECNNYNASAYFADSVLAEKLPGKTAPGGQGLWGSMDRTTYDLIQGITKDFGLKQDETSDYRLLLVDDGGYSVIYWDRWDGEASAYKFYDVAPHDVVPYQCLQGQQIAW